MNRRAILKRLGTAAIAGSSAFFRRADTARSEYSGATAGFPPLTITGVKSILVYPWHVVKVDTSEPGLYGLGCAY